MPVKGRGGAPTERIPLPEAGVKDSVGVGGGYGGSFPRSVIRSYQSGCVLFSLVYPKPEVGGVDRGMMK